ncbi:MAG TPA: ABC transporter permease [Acidobacteriaceae bacterium]|nr:ABC transporter permease [Acidobacteriaceae bacterium]
MSLTSRVRTWWRAVRRGDEVHAQIDEELRFHIESYAEDLMRRGLAREDAMRRARAELGSLAAARENSRQAWGTRWFDELRGDLRYAVRLLAKSPGFALIAIGSLALGIGANTAIFSLIDAVMLRSLPVRDPGRLMLLEWNAHHSPDVKEYSGFGDCERSTRSGETDCSLPLPVYEQLRSRTDIFSSLTAAAGPAKLDLSGNGAPSVVGGEIVAGNYFSTVGVEAAAGRVLAASDDLPSASPVAVLSYAYWQSAFGGKASAIGRTILLNQVPFTIIGVADRRFTNLTPGKQQDLWLTIAMLPRLDISWGRQTDNMANWWLLVLGRLTPGITAAQAQAAASIAFRNEVLHGPKPAFHSADEPRILLERAQEGLNGRRRLLKMLLTVLMSAVALLLLIACANVAGLLLARATARQREIAARLALGATRSRILRQLLTESVLLSSAGGLVGLGIAWWGVRAIVALVRFPYVLAPDARVLLFALGICLATGICFGLAPALACARLELTPALRDNGVRRRTGRLAPGNLLVAAQVALSVVVLIGAGLLLRTLNNLRSANPGFEARNVLTFEVNPTLLHYPNAKILSLYRDLRDRLASLPGVMSVSYSSEAMLDGSLWTNTVRVEGQPNSAEVAMFSVSPEFFRTMRIPLLAGRSLATADVEQAARAAEKDHSPRSPISVLVNRAFARHYFPGQSALGKRMSQGDHSDASGGAFSSVPGNRDWIIVGVVGDTNSVSLREPPRPMVYIPLTGDGAYFELRTAADPHTLVNAVREAALRVDNNLPLLSIQTQTAMIDEQLAQERLMARLSGFFGVVALVLASIGLYGLLSYAVSRRTREIGIRMALGAQRSKVLWLVAADGLALTGIGLLLGVAASWGVTRFLGSILYNVRPRDPLTLLGAVALLGLVSLAACSIPARRAAGVEPMRALRHE